MKKLFCFFLFSIFYLLFAGNAQAASLYITPASGNYSVGQTFTVTVRTDTQGQAINTAEASISFSADTLQLVRVAGSSIFSFQAPGSPGQGNGTAYFGGGLPSPGYTGGSGTVGTMTFRAVREGAASVSVSSGKVLLNDGSGTDALSATAGASYLITASIEAPPASGLAAEDKGPAVILTSDPDRNGWQNSRTVSLSWSRPEGAYGFSFELDQKSDTAPDNVLDTTITTTRIYEGLDDGAWYFHIKARGQQAGSQFGPITHFAINVATTAPEQFTIEPEPGVDINNVGSEFTIYFERDDPSLDRYEIYLDNVLVDTVNHNPYTFKNLQPGPHTIKIATIDKAGNRTEATLSIVAAPRLAPQAFLAQTFALPAYVLVLAGLLIFALALIAARFIRPRGTPDEDFSREIKKLQKEMDKNLDGLKIKINKKLLKLLQNYGGDISEEDLAAATAIKTGIGEAEGKIDEELTKLSETKRSKGKKS